VPAPAVRTRALESLADMLRERTRALRALGLDLADLRQPRRLELLEAEAETLRRSAEAGRAAADGLQAARLALATAEAAYARTAAATERARAAARARRAWLSAREDAARAAERLRTRRHALARAVALEGERAAAAAALEAVRVRALAGRGLPPASAEADLRSLQHAQADAAAARQRQAEAVAALQAHRAEDDALGVEAPAAVGNAVPATRDWGPIGRPAAPAVARLRRSAATLVRRTQAARALRDRLRDDAAALAPVTAFEALPAAVLELVSGFGQRERVLAERVQAARTRRDDLLERVERHRAAFADVRHLSAAQLRALEQFDEALERRRDPRPWRLAASVMLALAAGLVLPPLTEALGWTLPGGWWLAAGVGALVGALLTIGDGTAPARAAVAAAGSSATTTSSDNGCGSARPSTPSSSRCRRTRWRSRRPRPSWRPTRPRAGPSSTPSSPCYGRSPRAPTSTRRTAPGRA
jgi:hypothetical protein